MRIHGTAQLKLSRLCRQHVDRLASALRAAFWALAGVGLCACANSPTVHADRAQLADVVSTGVGTASGLQEANALVAPLVNSGAVGLVGLAGVKLGLNQLGTRQTPTNCRALLSTTTAAGWGATINNVALLVAPPLALAAIPVSLGTYYSAWRGSALDACYRGRLSYVVLNIPEARNRALPPEQERVISRIVGNWPALPRIHGTQAVAGRELVQATLIKDVDSLTTAIGHFDLDWEIVGAWNEQGAATAPVRESLLTVHLSTEQDGRNTRDTPNLTYDAPSGVVTLQIRDNRAWPIATLPLDGSIELAQRSE